MESTFKDHSHFQATLDQEHLPSFKFNLMLKRSGNFQSDNMRKKVKKKLEAKSLALRSN